MTDEAEIHANKRTDKTYVSPRIPTIRGALRIASKVIDSEGMHFATVKDEVLLRRTPSGRTEIIAKFLEDDRNVTVLTLQSFNGNSGLPHQTHFSFVGSEVPKLLEFFRSIASVDLSDGSALNITDTALQKLLLSKDQADSLVHENQRLFADAVREHLTSEDVVAIAYRKRQIDVFEKLLTDKAYFNAKKLERNASGDEALWQMFFEKNRWVFGYGLSYFFVSGFDNKKLEQYVEGFDLATRGKRADAVMRSHGAIGTICFVEIKTHETRLLDGSAPYRTGCWAPSKELAGAVAQVQGTVAAAVKNLYGALILRDEVGDPTGEQVFNFKPRAFVVIGSLGEFVGENGSNHDKIRSFELYRNSIQGIEIITFDELFERCRFIVQS